MHIITFPSYCIWKKVLFNFIQQWQQFSLLSYTEYWDIVPKNWFSCQVSLGNQNTITIGYMFTMHICCKKFNNVIFLSFLNISGLETFVEGKRLCILTFKNAYMRKASVTTIQTFCNNPSPSLYLHNGSLLPIINAFSL